MGQLEDNVSTLLERTEHIQESQRAGNANIKAIYEILNGDAKTVGLVTKVALLAQSMGRLWWWVGGISVCIMAVAVKGAFAGNSTPVEKFTCFIMSCVAPLFQ